MRECLGEGQGELGEWEEGFIREERGKVKNKVLRVYARDKLKKHIEMENFMIDQNELYAFSK